MRILLFRNRQHVIYLSGQVKGSSQSPDLTKRNAIGAHHAVVNSEHITRTFEYKLRPNKKFVEAAERTLASCRFLYNCALEHRIMHYRMTGKGLSYEQQSKQLTEARAELPELRLSGRNIQEDVLKRLDASFDGFFRRINLKDAPGFPRFKSREIYRSFAQQVEKGRRRLLVGDKLNVPRVGTVRVRLSRPIEGSIKLLRIVSRPDGWYALLVCDIPKPAPLPKTGKEIGIDLGIKSFATLSTGEWIANPQHLPTAEAGLKKAQRVLSRRKNGSGSRKKQRRKVAIAHLRVSRSRKDFHHKTAVALIRDYDRIVVEELNIKGMVRNHHLAKSISDVAWGTFIGILSSKAEEAGRTVEKVNPRNTSQMCSGCGAIVRKSLSVRVHRCGCGTALHRDHNAAINILRRGTAESTPVESADRGSTKQEQSTV